jgi:hypothetical protein
VITGSVADSSGAVIAGARVTFIDTRTNQVRERTASTAGIHEFRMLPAGGYRVEAEMMLRLDLKLEVGQVTESVEVQATAAFVQANDSNLSQVIDEKRVRELPLNGRNFRTTGA